MTRVLGRFLLRKSFFLFLGALVLVLGPLMVWPGNASAIHSWEGYHWARTSNYPNDLPALGGFPLEIENDVTGDWVGVLATAQTDWNVSSVLETESTNYRTPSRKCGALSGKVAACNNTYGYNGWLGIAQIWVSGGHITQGVTKMNDSYFNTSTYNSPAWKQMVMCQEIGHTFGLDHQDEVFDNLNLGTCMDYTSVPESNQQPNQHDYAQLEAIYAHLDSFNSWTDGAPASGGGKGKNGNGQGGAALGGDEDLGRPVRHTPSETLYEKDLGGGNKVLTWVRWSDPGNRTLR